MAFEYLKLDRARETFSSESKILLRVALLFNLISVKQMHDSKVAHKPSGHV